MMQVSVCVDNIDVAGEIINEVASGFNLENLASTAHFPAMMESLKGLLAKVGVATWAEGEQVLIIGWWTKDEGLGVGVAGLRVGVVGLEVSIKGAGYKGIRACWPRWGLPQGQRLRVQCLQSRCGSWSRDRVGD